MRPAKDGKVVLTQTDSKALCVTCHSEQAEKIEKAKVQHPGAQGECIACHNPHAGKTPGFIQPDPVNACLACHSEQAEQMKKTHLHQPAFGQGCATCHEPHGGDNAHLLRAQAATRCAWSATVPTRKPQKLEAEHLLTIFNGKVKLPEDYYVKNKVAILTVASTAWDIRRENHPVQDVMDPANITKVKTHMNA